MLSAATLIATLGAVLVAAWTRRRLLYALSGGLFVASFLTAPDLVGQKLLGALAMPAGLLWSGLLGAALVLAHREHKRAALTSLAFWLLYSLAGNTYVANTVMRSLEADYRARPAWEEPFDAVFVLGGGTGLRPSGEAQLTVSGDRVATAARLYHLGVTRKLVASGESIAGLTQAFSRDLRAETRAIWTELGVPDDAIIKGPAARNTSEEIASLAQLIEQNGWRRVGLLTSAWHLRRAMRLCDKAGLGVRPIAADFRGTDPALSVVGLVPSADAIWRIDIGVWEYLGAALGR